MATRNRKRKLPITSAPSRPPTKTSAAGQGTKSKATRALIRRFHVLLKRREQLRAALSLPPDPGLSRLGSSGESDSHDAASSSSSSSSSTAALRRATNANFHARPHAHDELSAVEGELLSLGGLEFYQRASALGQSKERGGDSSAVLSFWLEELGLCGGRRAQGKVKGKGEGKGRGGDAGGDAPRSALLLDVDSDKSGTQTSATSPTTGSGTRKLRLLDVGALSPFNYARQQFWIDAIPIDLRARVPGILEQDFMQRPVAVRGVGGDTGMGRRKGKEAEKERGDTSTTSFKRFPETEEGRPTKRAKLSTAEQRGGERQKSKEEQRRQGWPDLEDGFFDVISLSLVLNFVPDPGARGAMLSRTLSFLHPSHSPYGGLLFIVLPTPCLANSRYLTFASFVSLLRAVGYERLLREKRTERVSYLLFGRKAAETPDDGEAEAGAEDGEEGTGDGEVDRERWVTKKEINPGKGRNNFCVLFDPASTPRPRR